MFKYFTCVITCWMKKMEDRERKKVSIVVLGDIGRSPRMQYHGLSFVEEGFDVQFVGYSGSEPIEKLRTNPHVKFKYIKNCPDFKNYLPSILAYLIKALWQIITLFIALLQTSFPDFLLVQNPPAIPALGVCYFYCKLFKVQFIIDWHNYAYSILTLSLKQEHPLVRFSKALEFYFGKKAHKNLCVTKAMKEDLEKNHNILATTFYDRPPHFFKPPSIEEKHKLFLELGLEHEVFVKDCTPGETVFTQVTGDFRIVLKENRPGLLISSTSWTEDENFYTLINALDEYNKMKETHDLPVLVCVITGKGPLKEFYRKIIKDRQWSHVNVITPWLKAEDYPVLLGSADLGVSLHISSSGLDLPMKVVDMFGCSVPVCAVNFNCLHELVHHEKNGFIFNNEGELVDQIKQWFKGFPNSESELHQTFRENLEKFVSLRWHDNWKFNVQPLF